MFVLLCIASATNNSLHAQSSLDKTFTFNNNKVKLKALIADVQKQTHVNISFSSSIINTEQVIAYNATKKKVADFLQDLEKSYKIGYQLVGDRIILYKINDKPKTDKLTEEIKPTQEGNVIRGVVKNEKGETMQGVTIIEKGKPNAVASDAKGEFKIKVTNSKASLVFSFTGYEPIEVAVSSSSIANISLTSISKALDDVVVVGYGTIKKSDLTGSVSKVKLDNAAQQTSTSFEQLLQGKAAGVNITQTSGDPGSGIMFNIRGTNSLGANQPLIVIDGVPIESDNATVSSKTGADYWTSQEQPSNVLANLNPNDIESLEILKDASSTAIFGSRGANGVVMITTKRGKAGRDKISYNYRYDASQLPKEIAMLTGPQFAQYANEATYNSDSTKGQFFRFPLDTIAKLGTVNFQEIIFNRSNSQDHQVSLLGGDDRTKYALGAYYTTINGVVVNTYYKKQGLSFNLDRQFAKNFKVGISAKVNFSDNRAGLQSTNHANQGGSVVTTALRSTPTAHYINDDGTINTSLSNNPALLLSNSVNKTKNMMSLVNIFGEYSIIPNDLKLRVSGSFNQNNNQSNTYWGRGTVAGDASGGQAFQITNQNLNYLTEYTLSYNKKVFRNDRINAVAGYTSQSWESSAFGVNAKGFPNDQLGAYGFEYATALINLPKATLKKWNLESYLGRMNYTMNDKYLLTLTGRVDGSSRLAPSHKWDFFPSVALGWNLYKEKFFKRLAFVSNAKVRTSYGFSGNQNIHVGATKALLSSNRASNGVDSISTGEVISSFENPNLHWEKTGQLDVGIDFGFLNDKFQLSIDLYQKTTNDLLLDLAIPSDNGFSSYATNLGKVENRGIEIEANARFLIANKVQWRIAGNIAFNQNKVLNLGENGQIYGDNLLPTALDQYGTIAQPGYAIGSFYGYKIKGIYQNKAEIAKGSKDPVNPLPQPGDFKYADLNGNGTIGPEDRTILGNPNPKYTFGLTNTFSYKGFELSCFLMGKIGQSVLNLNRFYSDGLVYSSSGNLRQEAWLGRWHGEGTSNYYPRAKTTGSLFDKRVSDHLVEDGSFIRLKNVSLSYNVDTKKSRYLKQFNALKFFVNATNLFVITNYKGFDSEVSGFGLTAITQGVDFGTIPQYKTYSLGINVGL